MKGKKTKLLINFFIVIGTLTSIIWIGVEQIKDNKIKEENTLKVPYYTQDLNAQPKIEEEAKQNVKQYPKEEIESQYKGYEVIAKLEIPTIELETYILKQYSKNTLNISVTKFWGANPNQKGNFCIAGHNFQNKNMFHNLRKLEIGDNLFVSDNEIGKVEYEIYDIYTVEPENVKCLSQETMGKREVTLITCTSDSKRRIIVKAKERD